MKYTFIILIVITAFSCRVKDKNNELNVVCNEVIKEDVELSDVVFIKSCKFYNHLFKSIGQPDDKGRYSYDYELFKIDKTDTIRINNLDFFNSKAIELEKIININLKAAYNSNSKIPQISNCMNWIEFRYYKLDEFGISFTDNNQMEFNINYGIGGACFNVSSSSVTIELSELKRYLK